MIQIASIHHVVTGQPYVVKTKHLTLGGDIQISLMIKALNEHTISVIEEFFLEAVSDVSWDRKGLDEDFGYITEKYNKFIKNTDHKGVDVGVFFGVNIDDILMFSVIGEIYMIMKEGNRKWSSVSTSENHGETDFSYVSSGIIPYDSTLYISSSPILEEMGVDLLDDFSQMENTLFESNGIRWMDKEYTGSIDIIRIQRELLHKKSTMHVIGQLDIAREKIGNYLGTKNYSRYFKDFCLSIDSLFRNKPKFIQTGIVVSGVIICFFLLYILFYEVFNNSKRVTESDSKQQLIDAKGYLDVAEKNLSNNTIFTDNIKKAEDILFTLRNNESYLKDTQDLLGKISSMKKQLNDIETVEIQPNSSIIPFNPQDISPIHVFEYDKKITLIGKYGTILDYVAGGPVPKVTGYPLGEEAIDADMNADGEIFILTKNNKILSRRQNSIVSVNIDTNGGSEKAKRVRTYMSNLYLIGDNSNEVFRHKPGANGFGPKTMILQGYTGSDIRDIGVDGGFFILKNSGQIRRIMTSPVYTDKSIVINEIPGDYSLSNDENLTLYVRPNLSYVYLLDGYHVWIFQPDSKNYKDITSWKYIAQIELSTKEEIRSISIPYDGLVYVATNLGVYSVKYEIVEGKIMLK